MSTWIPYAALGPLQSRKKKQRKNKHDKAIKQFKFEKLSNRLGFFFYKTDDEGGFDRSLQNHGCHGKAGKGIYGLLFLLRPESHQNKQVGVQVQNEGQ